jgi:aminopeptidase N
VIIGDPGPESLFDGAVYIRGAMTLQKLRVTVGDNDFFRILRGWARSQAGENVTTDEFIRLAERISGQQLDELFEEWLFTPEKPGPDARDRAPAAISGTELWDAPAAVRALVERLRATSRLPLGK